MGGSSNILSLENIVNRDLAEQRGIKTESTGRMGCRCCEKRTVTGFHRESMLIWKEKSPFEAFVKPALAVDSASITHLAGIQLLAS